MQADKVISGIGIGIVLGMIYMTMLLKSRTMFIVAVVGIIILGGVYLYIKKS